jgi:hypothetical protein
MGPAAAAGKLRVVVVVAVGRLLMAAAAGRLRVAAAMGRPDWLQRTAKRKGYF